MDRWRAASLLGATVLLLGSVSACAPQSPDHEGWTDLTLQTLEDVASEVATVELALRLGERELASAEYVQVVALDAEEAAGQVAEKFTAVQPPVGEDPTYRDVSSVLSDATDLLAEARIAVVREETAAYAGLRRDLGKVGDDLTAAMRKVRAP